MKKFVIIILIVLAFISCDNPKSARHLFRAASRASQIEKKKENKIENDYLISYFKSKDSSNNIVFTALYTLPKDTSLFFLNISLNMPEKLRFEGNLDSCTVKSYFFKSIKDTTNKKLAIKKYFRFYKKNNFYRIIKY